MARGKRGGIVSEKIWDANKLINTDHLTDEQWDIIADIFKDYK